MRFELKSSNESRQGEGGAFARAGSLPSSETFKDAKASSLGRWVEISSVVHQPGGEPPKKFNGLRERESKIPRRRHFHNLPDFPRRLRRIAGRIFFRSIRGKNGNTTAKAASPGACSLCATTVLTIPQTGKTAALPETISWPVRILTSGAASAGRPAPDGAAGKGRQAAASRRRVKPNWLPLPTSLLTHISSPIHLSSSLAMESPRPLPMPLCALSTL